MNLKEQKQIFLFLLGLLGVLIAAIIIFYRLGDGSIDLWDEAITAGRSLSIFNDHSIFNLKVNGTLSIRKPFLIYLLNSFLFNLIGINEFALRFFNAFFGFGIFILVVLIAYNFISFKYAWLSSWLLLGAFKLLQHSREALTDTIFSFGLLLAISGLLLELKFKKNSFLFYMLYFIGLLLGLLGKGPVAFIIPIIVLPSLFFLHEKKIMKKVILYSAIAGFIFSIWFVIQSLYFKDFIKIFIFEEYLERFNYQSKFLSSHIQSPLYYITHLWYFFRLTGWLGLLSILYYFFLFKKRYKNRLNEDNFNFWTFLAISSLIYLLIISIASHKCSRYFMPLYPLLVLVFLAYLEHIKRKNIIKINMLLVAIALVIGWVATYSHYEIVPDYLPQWKEVALKAIEKGKKENINSFCTNEPSFALILHFYSNTIVEVPCNNNKKFIHIQMKRDKRKLYDIIIR